MIKLDNYLIIYGGFHSPEVKIFINKCKRIIAMMLLHITENNKYFLNFI